MATLFNLEPFVTADSANVTADSTITAGSGGLSINIPDLSAVDFANRLIRLFPRGWLSDAAKASGGAAYATFLGIGTPLARILPQLQFIAAGLRVKFAYGSALDVISVDYFGPNGLPKISGETDAAFQARILKNLIVPRVTKEAIGNGIYLITGIEPRMSESWTAGGDCAAYDLNSYYGVDGAENVAPGRYGDALIFTGFADVPIPVSSVTGGYPIYGIDIGLAYDVGLSSYDMASLATAVVPTSSVISDVMARIQAFKAMGITVGVRFLSRGAASNVVYGAVSSTAHSSLLDQTNEAISYVLRSWQQAFGVWTEVLPWLASAWIAKRGLYFEISASAAPITAYQVNWTAATFVSPSPLALRAPVKNEQTSLTGVFAIPAGTVPIIMPDWQTIAYVTGMTPASVDISLSAAGPGNLDIIFKPGIATAVPTGDTTISLASNTISAYSVYATPSWETTMSVAKTPSSFMLTFGTPAPDGAVVYWAM